MIWLFDANTYPTDSRYQDRLSRVTKRPLVTFVTLSPLGSFINIQPLIRSARLQCRKHGTSHEQARGEEGVFRPPCTSPMDAPIRIYLSAGRIRTVLISSHSCSVRCAKDQNPD